MKLHHRPRDGRDEHAVTPRSAGWRHLSFRVARLNAGESLEGDTGGDETLVVFLGGKASVTAGSESYRVEGRRDVFAGLPHSLYLPPGTSYELRAETDLEVALGGAPAKGRCPQRLLTPGDYRRELRGERNVQRQVVHVLSPQVHGEHLFVFEVYSPSGNWSGFPPHRHDGRMGSTYLEETYYFRIAPPEGFGSIRVYTGDTDLDEMMVVKDRDLVLVPEGYHPTSTAPGSNMYFLNFLAGPGSDYKIVNDPAFDWVGQDWAGGALKLPLFED
ncbi:MAG TPA: 5-deoxy-glucuronate isomerase [Deinococcales bacterium]|nr:5-deoxy-glucuronate isomerase [Deinococcales bacterium]